MIEILLRMDFLQWILVQ